MTILPETLSELLDLAVSNVEACENDDMYLVDEEHYLFADNKVKAVRVGLSGAVMAQSLGCSHCKSRNPDDFNDQDGKNTLRNKLRAINEVAEGNVIAACGLLGRYSERYGTVCDDDMYCDGLEIADYSSDPDGFKIAISDIAHDLRGFGL